ncbi:hypothetical protein SAMN05444166_3032 [Singulisphaera sp. GP187]|nr:hypothetical protein SAMN05444166_3032 [Singulisphaera sp. GP187]
MNVSAGYGGQWLSVTFLRQVLLATMRGEAITRAKSSMPSWFSRLTPGPLGPADRGVLLGSFGGISDPCLWVFGRMNLFGIIWLGSECRSLEPFATRMDVHNGFCVEAGSGPGLY